MAHPGEGLSFCGDSLYMILYKLSVCAVEVAVVLFEVLYMNMYTNIILANYSCIKRLLPACLPFDFELFSACFTLFASICCPLALLM